MSRHHSPSVHVQDGRRDNGRRNRSSVLSSGCCHDIARQAYYGGRVEVFRTGHTTTDPTIHYGDVNSMYPFAMLQPMPIGRVAYFKGSANLERLAKHRIGFVHCDVQIPTSCYLPPLPYRHEGKLIFPVGRFTGTWDWTELASLKRVGGRILKVHESVWFRQKVIFAEYVHTLYALRDKSLPGYSEPIAFLAKLLLNSLYGKFGMGEEREKVHLNPSDSDLVDLKLRPMMAEEDSIWLEKVVCQPAYVIPQISAHITAVSRTILWSAMMDILDKGHRIYYCDTDSIISSFPFPHSTKLGEIKLEDTICEARFVAPKLYSYTSVEGHKKARAKGFSRGFSDIKTSPEDIENLLSGESIESTTLTKMRTVLRSGQGPTNVVRDKQLRSDKSKRILLPDGNTKPITIGGIESSVNIREAAQRKRNSAARQRTNGSSGDNRTGPTERDCAFTGGRHSLCEAGEKLSGRRRSSEAS